ncbi:MAG TPA: serine hydrolase [Vicinamibacterales bacterium]|nr:serine hydrolase [Vicinamibacterales bacterium]
MRLLTLLLVAGLLVPPKPQATAESQVIRADAGQPSADRAGTTPGFADALALAAGLPRLHSLLVSRRGEIVLERYYNGARAARAANIKSAAKSIISALVGIAIERRLIPGADAPIASYFPELAKDRDPAKRTITIEDLLTMRSGLETTSNRNYGAWVQSRNWVQHALARPLLSAPGTLMEYSTGNTHLLSAILTTVTRVSTWQFGNDALARPLGFTLARWPQDPQGIYFGGNDMLLTPRQMLAFGELYLNRGRIGDRQIVPASWIERSFVPRGRSSWSDQEYGYGWWMRDLGGHRAYYAWGFGGQYIFVVPDLDLVVVTTSSSTVAEDRRSHRRDVFDLVEHLVVGPIAATN